MNWEAIGALAELCGAAAVVVTLVYLALQVRQNNELRRSESRQALVGNDVASLAANLEHTDVFAKYVSEQMLSPEEQLRMSFMFALDIRNREFEYFQYQHGLLDEETWLSYRQVLLINHSSALGRKWWDRVGRSIVDPEFAKAVDQLLLGASHDVTYRNMSSWADQEND